MFTGYDVVTSTSAMDSSARSTSDFSNSPENRADMRNENSTHINTDIQFFPGTVRSLPIGKSKLGKIRVLI
jgi:hypothetical protein